MLREQRSDIALKTQTIRASDGKNQNGAAQEGQTLPENHKSGQTSGSKAH
jgi:hypothetical protein